MRGREGAPIAEHLQANRWLVKHRCVVLKRKHRGNDHHDTSRHPRLVTKERLSMARNYDKHYEDGHGSELREVLKEGEPSEKDDRAHKKEGGDQSEGKGWPIDPPFVDKSKTSTRHG